MSRPHLLLGPLLAALALGSSGCSKVREISACRGIASDVNSALDEIELLSKQKPVDEPRIANRYAALAKALTPRAQGEAPLAIALRDYVAILTATESALKSHHLAAKTQYGRVHEPRRELERLVKRERAAASRLEAECHN